MFETVLDNLLLVSPLVLEDVHEANSLLITCESLVEVITFVLTLRLRVPIETVELDCELLGRNVDVELGIGIIF